MSPSATNAEVEDNNLELNCPDTIAQLSAPLSETTSLSPLVHLLTLAYQVKIPPRSKQERLVTLLNTLTQPANSSSSSPSSKSDPQVRTGSYIRYLSPVLNGFAGMHEFEAAVGAFSEPGEFREFWDLDGSNLITEFVSDTGSQRMIAGSDVPFLDKFVRDSSMRIGLTKKDAMLVLVPGTTEVGDGVSRVANAGVVSISRGDTKGEKWHTIIVANMSRTLTNTSGQPCLV
ncbi:hypothetical protein LIA77_05334 [Sarocladium implicatum]|nr:hypothetical protein LIA77_05334 [Sarocladium implicatum]